MEKSRNVRPKVDKRQTRSNPNRVGLQYDSISGYMVLISAPTTLETSELEAEINTYKVVDSHPGTEVEAKFAHNPSLSKDGQFQPGNTGWSPEAPSSLHSTVECTLADDIGALFTSTPTSQDAQGRLQVPQETKRSPFVNINYSPGSGLGTLYGSDSITSTQPQPDSSSANGDIYKLDLHAGLVTGTNLEGSPGSEPEAKFMPDPANRAVQSSSSGFETQTPSKQTDTSIDCLPGNEVDAKLSSEIGSLGLEYDGPFNQTTNTATMTDAQERAKCSPGSEIKAQILSKSASHKITPSEAQTSVDCPPGSELEARLAGNAASIEKSLSQPELPTSLDTSKMTRVAVDNTPRNELKTKIFSEMASAECPSKNKDVTALDASDIRPRYTPLEAKVQANMLDFDASEDRNNDSILESQDSAEKGKQPAASQAPSPQFHILAFDTSTSQVSAAQADSFFAVGEHRQPIEILSRLQNPAKFLPYFEKMQEDGYEIATGGGNILVFRKTQSTPRHTLSETATDQPATHAEISRHPCHNSKDPATTCSRAPWQSTSMLVSATGSSNSSPEPTTKPKSLCREIGRRMLIVGTATAATCYALGVMTEFFRTGGNDRQGIDGFTVLESDRRRQE
ncbi:hypothetical protein PDIDSM_3655 [Penicillium digitatum]|nr:hypothetical protein PDIDSM_3655 [Penicillium digitatum]